MEDLSEKPCPCGETAGEVIGFNHRSTDDTYVPYRVGWYCPECKHFEQAIGRETWINTKILNNV
jgi:hypothetical protein